MAEDFHSRLKLAKEAYGDCIEVGVYNGDSAIKWKRVFPDKEYFAFDTYSGMPVTKLDDDETHLKSIGLQNLMAFEDIHRRLKNNGITAVRGIFPDEVLDKIPRLIAFAYIDADNYMTTLQALHIVRQRLAIGGVIVLHDYYRSEPGEGAPGVKKAVNQFLAEYPEYKMFISDQKDLVLICK